MAPTVLRQGSVVPNAANIPPKKQRYFSMLRFLTDLFLVESTLVCTLSVNTCMEVTGYWVPLRLVGMHI